MKGEVLLKMRYLGWGLTTTTIIIPQGDADGSDGVVEPAELEEKRAKGIAEVGQRRGHCMAFGGMFGLGEDVEVGREGDAGGDVVNAEEGEDIGESPVEGTNGLGNVCEVVDPSDLGMLSKDADGIDEVGEHIEGTDGFDDEAQLKIDGVEHVLVGRICEDVVVEDAKSGVMDAARRGIVTSVGEVDEYRLVAHRNVADPFLGAMGMIKISRHEDVDGITNEEDDPELFLSPLGLPKQRGHVVILYRQVPELRRVALGDVVDPGHEAPGPRLAVVAPATWTLIHYVRHVQLPHHPLQQQRPRLVLAPKHPEPLVGPRWTTFTFRPIRRRRRSNNHHHHHHQAHLFVNYVLELRISTVVIMLTVVVRILVHWNALLSFASPKSSRVASNTPNTKGPP